MSNTERQREFRKRNPGYYGRRKATLRAALKRSSEQHMAAYLERLRAEAKAASAETGSVAIECGMI